MKGRFDVMADVRALTSDWFRLGEHVRLI